MNLFNRTSVILNSTLFLLLFTVILPRETQAQALMDNTSRDFLFYITEQGVLPTADTHVPGYSFNSQAQDGEYAFRVVHKGARIDFGPGSNDYCWSNGALIQCMSSLTLAAGQSFTADVIGSVSGGIIYMFPGSWMVLQGVGSLAACNASSAGGLIRLSGDGRIYECDGTSALRLLRSLPPTGEVIDPVSIPGSSCILESITVDGALLSDVSVIVTTSTPVADGLMLTNARVSALNTVSFSLCNITSNPVDQTSTTFTATVLR